MSSFITPAPWDSGEQPGQGGRGFNTQVCFTCAASVCVSLCITVHLPVRPEAAGKTGNLSLWSWKLFT